MDLCTIEIEMSPVSPIKYFPYSQMLFDQPFSLLFGNLIDNKVLCSILATFPLSLGHDHMEFLISNQYVPLTYFKQILHFFNP